MLYQLLCLFGRDFFRFTFCCSQQAFKFFLAPRCLDLGLLAKLTHLILLALELCLSFPNNGLLGCIQLGKPFREGFLLYVRSLHQGVFLFVYCLSNLGMVISKLRSVLNNISLFCRQFLPLLVTSQCSFLYFLQWVGPACTKTETWT